MAGRQAADSRDEVLMDALRVRWAGIYDVGYAASTYLARRLTGGPLLAAGTPAGLEAAIEAECARLISAGDAR